MAVAVAAPCTSFSIPTVHAQNVEDRTAPIDPIPTNTGPSWAGDTIVVTGIRDGYAVPETASATRTTTPLIHVPQSVQVLTGALLREQDRRQLGEALANVSGVVGNRPEEGLTVGPIVRGFMAEIYQDGLPMFGAFSAANDPASLVGIRRIDVLKGPSATLYGGGVGSPLGGLINIESEHPGTKLQGYAAIRAGSFATFNPYGELDVPITTGISARIAGEYQSNDHWVDRIEGERIFVQPSIAFQLGTRTDLMVQGQYGRREQLEYSGLPATQTLAGEVDRNAFPGAPNGQPRSSTTNQMVTGTLRHDFGDDVRLTVTGRYYESRVPQFGTFIYPDMYPADPATPTTYPLLALNMLSHFEEATFDANLVAKTEMVGGTHTFLVGASYDHTDFYSDMAFTGMTRGSIDLADPTYDVSFGEILPPSLLQTDRYETRAIYAQDQADYGWLHLTGSLRYTRFKFREDQQATDETYHRLSPRIGATVDVVPGVALYAGYATAFRGAFGLMSRFTPRPETSRNVEGGIKLAATGIGLSGTLAVYEQTRNNVATPDPDPAFPFFAVQTGQQRSRGIEADLIWEPRPAFSMIANYAYTDAAVTRDTNTSLIDDRLPRVPRHSGRIAARYRVLGGAAKGLSLGAGVTAFTAREITLPNSVSVPGYAAIDAQASYDIGRFTVQVSAVNLGGARSFDTYQYFAFPVVMPTQPRSAFVTLKTRL